MSYEYKELIKTYTEYIMDDYEVVDYIEAGKELDHVYAQATKADEYEAKARAFDEIRSAHQIVLEDVRSRGTKLPSDFDKFTLMSERIINKYESGESGE